MYRERIIQEKDRQNLSKKSIADRSKLRLPDETISRILSGKTADPGINSVLDIIETLGMKPYEAFMDDTLAAEFRAFLELKSKSEETEAERIKLMADNEALNATNAGLTDRIRVLEIELKHKEREVELLERLNKALENK